MVPLRSIFDAAAKSPLVIKAAVGVSVVIVTMVGMKEVFGSDVRMTTAEASACAVGLADKSARLELTEKALGTCSKAMDLCAGAP
jgi:adenosylcobinamide amidohydrolase